MATATVSKTIEISDLKCCKEESIYERLQILTVSANNHYKVETNSISTQTPQLKSVDTLFKIHKDKAIRTALLHRGSLNY